MRYRKIIYFALAGLVSFMSQANNILDIEGGDATSVGIYVKSLEDGKVLVNENASVALTPASITKTVTSATALSLLGPKFRFFTPIELVGTRKDNSWNGNLVIRSCGDPTIENPDLKMNMGFTDSIISNLKRLGIKNISGSIIIEEQLSEPGPIPQWEVEDIAWPYGAGLYGFNYAGNYVRVYPNTSTTVPESDLYVEVRTAADGRTDMLRGVNSEDLIVWTSAKNRQNPRWNVNATIPNPAETYEALLKKRLKSAGISVGENNSTTAVGSETLKVYTHASATLEDICRDLMKRSDNLFAEGMLRAILPGESRDKCIKKEKEFWTAKGVNAKYTIINDGSGLTRGNKISPQFLGQLLEKMAQSEYASTFIDFFPIAGVDGTLKSFLENTRLKGRLALKTGSVSAVQTYAGYKIDGEGRPTHVVVVMVNGFFCSRSALRKKIEAYLLKLFEN